MVLWLLPSKALITTQRKGGRGKCLLSLRKAIIIQISVSKMKKKLSVKHIQSVTALRSSQLPGLFRVPTVCPLYAKSKQELWKYTTMPRRIISLPLHKDLLLAVHSESPEREFVFEGVLAYIPHHCIPVGGRRDPESLCLLKIPQG